MTVDGWLGGDIIDDGGVEGEVASFFVGEPTGDLTMTVDGWLDGVTDCGGWIVGRIIDDSSVVCVIDDGGAVTGLGNTYLTLACLKKRGGNAWRLLPCVRFRALSRCRSSSVVFLGTRLPLPEPGNCFVTRIQSI